VVFNKNDLGVRAISPRPHSSGEVRIDFNETSNGKVTVEMFILRYAHRLDVEFFGLRKCQVMHECSYGDNMGTMASEAHSNYCSLVSVIRSSIVRLDATFITYNLKILPNTGFVYHT